MSSNGQTGRELRISMKNILNGISVYMKATLVYPARRHAI